MNTNESWNQNEEKLLKSWLYNAEVSRNAHRIAAKYYKCLHMWLGGTLCVLATLLGTGLIANLEEFPIIRWCILGASASVLVLSFLQTFLKFYELAERHEDLRAGFASLCREIQVDLTCQPQKDDKKDCDILKRIRMRYDELSKHHTHIREKIWKQAKDELDKF